MATANWGTTSSALAAWIRHSTRLAGTGPPWPPRYGELPLEWAGRGGRAGSRTATATSSAAARQNEPRKSRAADRLTAPAVGRTRAATATPSGCALCRMPMASPRWPAGNQPRMSRPLAAYTDAPAAPARARHRPSAPSPCTMLPASRITPASARPVPSTSRSPQRSAAAPQATSVSSSPAVGQATSRPACSRDSPSARKAGIR